jgi:hypothetical protein
MTGFWSLQQTLSRDASVNMYLMTSKSLRSHHLALRLSMHQAQLSQPKRQDVREGGEIPPLPRNCERLCRQPVQLGPRPEFSQ